MSYKGQTLNLYFKMYLHLIILVLSGMFSYAAGCSCAPFDPEINYCEGTSGFAVVFKIKDNGTVDGFQRVYDVDILFKYLFKAPGEDLIINKLYTGVHGAMCGIRLRPDSFYIITGYFEVDFTSDGPAKMRTSLCNVQDYFKKNPIVNGVPPPCERLDRFVEYSE